MASVELRGVAKRFGDTPVVRGVDLACADGELLVLVGPSGCGKSTLLRIVAGLEQPDEGEVWIGGRRVDALAPRDRDVAMVFQSYALYPHMTVRDNLAFALTLRRVPRAEIDARVARVAEALGLADLLARRPAQLSGGQRQRVAMGRAMVREPAAFLLDEPLSNLDANLRARMRVEIKRLHARLSATMIYVTHDQVEAMTLADRIAVLHQGALQQVGAPADLYHRPANAFVAGFLGAPPINLLDANAADGEVAAGPVRARLLGAPAGPVRLGVRPEALRLRRPGDALSIDAVVDVVEPLGGECHVHARAGDAAITARLSSADAAGLSPGAPLALGADADDLHLFDAATGARV